MEEYLKNETSNEPDSTQEYWSGNHYDAQKYELIVKNSFDIIEQAFVDYMNKLGNEHIITKVERCPEVNELLVEVQDIDEKGMSD